jgi:uncharacterized protein YjbI with pentapeptide repeats
MKKTSFINCKIEKSKWQISLSESNIDKCFFSDSELILSSSFLEINECIFQSDSILLGNNITLNNCVIENCTMVCDDAFHSKMNFNNCTFEGSKFNLDEKSNSFISFYKTKFRNQEVCFPINNNYRIKVQNCEFLNCTLKGMIFTEYEYSKQKIEHCKGYILINDLFEKESSFDFDKTNSSKYKQIDELFIVYEPQWRKNKREILEEMGKRIIENLDIKDNFGLT